MVDWLSLAVPLAYLGILIGSLATFSSLYRKRKAQKAASLEPWFPAHLQRDIYFSLLHLDPSASQPEKKTPAIPESVLKAALLRRATEDIRRVLALRNQKQALSMLLQRGSVGDDLWQRFMRAEKEMEEEVKDVVSEANAYAPNWGQTIFQSANEMMNNDLYRRRMAEQQGKLAEERQWWDNKKTSIKEGFMKELNEGPASGSPASTTPASKASEATSAAPTTSVQGSDDDAVLVEAETSANSPSTGGGGGGGGGGGKKKKGKGKK
ncbi:Pre protein translocase subunit Sec66-domain-containing protein [Penicillium hispanicum]|uniref:Pre protein translocase subunit Sec66-domain-containing protein n=1 Tax=Penicillium hispanicum TaxID=1080232 RepID=UPI0025412A9B|nr:Pre protein translocase subunit Sec66-domain-containing protein [Penicillium hispanicum]KAJ5577823.1 Pre protein translocase subunit Sec66-domain-containing protein [Penicillium hispanicum]